MNAGLYYILCNIIMFRLGGMFFYCLDLSLEGDYFNLKMVFILHDAYKFNSADQPKYLAIFLTAFNTELPQEHFCLSNTQQRLYAIPKF